MIFFQSRAPMRQQPTKKEPIPLTIVMFRCQVRRESEIPHHALEPRRRTLAPCRRTLAPCRVHLESRIMGSRPGTVHLGATSATCLVVPSFCTWRSDLRMRGAIGSPRCFERSLPWTLIQTTRDFKRTGSDSQERKRTRIERRAEWRPAYWPHSSMVVGGRA